jgi:hypothetical protein
MPGDEDDRDLDSGLGQLGLKIQAASLRQPDVEDQATCDIGQRALQQLWRRTEHFRPQPDRAKQPVERLSHRGIVVDDEHHRILGGCSVTRWGGTVRHLAAS